MEILVEKTCMGSHQLHFERLRRYKQSTTVLWDPMWICRNKTIMGGGPTVGTVASRRLTALTNCSLGNVYRSNTIRRSGRSDRITTGNSPMPPIAGSPEEQRLGAGCKNALPRTPWPRRRLRAAALPLAVAGEAEDPSPHWRQLEMVLMYVKILLRHRVVEQLRELGLACQAPSVPRSHFVKFALPLRT